MLNYVYWKNDPSPNNTVLINLSLLAGTLIGQLIFGVLGDRYGRRRLYGWELLILTVATFFMTIASKGALQNTSRVAWIAAWRFFMGIGIGGDYPLSAVITAEFAPRRHRGKMLATLFYMQACGAFVANIVTIIAVTSLQNSIPTDNVNCDANCIDVLDRIWRWIVGLGAVPPALATLVRWFIPESPRYTMEVEKDPDRAKRDVASYFPEAARPGQDRATEITVGSTSSAGGGWTSQTEPTMVFGDPVELQDIALAEPALPLPEPKVPIMRKETWREYWTGLWQFMIVDGNWTDLAGTSLAWMALDFAFYCLSVNNPNILNKLWNTQDPLPVYPALVQNAYRALIAVSIGSLIGGYLFIVMARYRWTLQYYGFWVLTGGFIVVGVCYMTLLNTRYFAAVIVLYSLCSLFFNLGPNTSTDAISAEVFPTKYRCTCAGISAAAGKLGSIVAQVFLTYVKFGPQHQGVFTQSSPWLGAVLLV
jgi:PHS family inorganic phosphate transporter-like MFS transporter